MVGTAVGTVSAKAEASTVVCVGCVLLGSVKKLSGFRPFLGSLVVSLNAEGVNAVTAGSNRVVVGTPVGSKVYTPLAASVVAMK